MRDELQDQFLLQSSFIILHFSSGWLSASKNFFQKILFWYIFYTHIYSWIKISGKESTKFSPSLCNCFGYSVSLVMILSSVVLQSTSLNLNSWTETPCISMAIHMYLMKLKSKHFGPYRYPLFSGFREGPKLQTFYSSAAALKATGLLHHLNHRTLTYTRYSWSYQQKA